MKVEVKSAVEQLPRAGRSILVGELDRQLGGAGLIAWDRRV